MARRLRVQHPGAIYHVLNRGDRRETDERRAERILAEELRRWRWKEAELGKRRKTDPKKVHIALRLRRETVQTLDWIAERLQMGCRHTLANCLKQAQTYQ